MLIVGRRLCSTVKRLTCALAPIPEIPSTADVRRPWRHARGNRRAPVPRYSRTAHLRRCNRSPEVDCRSRASQRGKEDMSLTQFQILLPEGWPRPQGYSNGVIAEGRQIFIAGQVGWDAQGRFESPDLAGQVKQSLENVLAV